ncbi:MULTISPECIES: sensor histidine kinase [unclassified Carboxylicivirga]|uniref:sensor histidine kinase n=1 Tax=Carboxylicivirga TaxID=1628153 RepID=UPI003D35045D
MRNVIFNRWNVVALLVLVVIFSLAAYGIRVEMQQQSNRVSQSLIQISTRGYQTFLEQYFSGYTHVLEQLAGSALGFEKRTAINKNELAEVLQSDSTIAALAVRGEGWTQTLSNDSARDAMELMQQYLQSAHPEAFNGNVLFNRYLYLSISHPTAEDVRAAICIDLLRVHQHFIEKDIYTSIYQVILNARQECIYHPERYLIGQKYEIPERLLVSGQFNQRLYDSVHLEVSDYLQLPVFKTYKAMNLAGTEVLVLSVSPGFEIKEMVAEQEQSLFILFVLFLVLLVAIMIFGMMRWKREFLLRASTEQENLNLQLKHEKQKTDAVSMKLELLRSGLNSHFMFNSLGTVRALLSEGDGLARRMLSDLSKLYRYQLRIEGERTVSLHEELTFTRIYVDVINFRMSSSLEMDCGNLSDYAQCRVLPVSLQLLVENAIKHNVSSPQQPLHIHLSVKEGYVVVINQLRPKVAFVETSGKGLKNLSARYALITQRECLFKEENGCYVARIPIIK